MTLYNQALVDALPDCSEPGCVRKAHGLGQGVHVGECGETWIAANGELTDSV